MAQTGASVDPLFLSFQLALAGRYSIDRELGRGGTGVVYLAREVHLDRLVAIKLLPPDRAADPTLRERFLREARLAAKLSHPNIIPIHAVEDTGGFVFYVMAFVNGETLAERVRTRGPFTGAEGARLLREVAWALAYAHGQGLVHRDVKPENILLESATGRVLVADFGIASVAGDAGTDAIAGTPEFMSPEQALGGQVDARSDLYSLGATAFFTFSGRMPFEGKSATEVLAKQVTEKPPALASLGVVIPRKLTALVDRCLAKEPDLRPASAQTLAEQLGVALEQRRELPPPLRAFVRRHGRLDSSGTLLSGVALLFGSIGISWFFGGRSAFATVMLGVTAGPLSYLVYVARRLMMQGFTHQDLKPAFQLEIDQAKEERSVERQVAPPLLEQTLAKIVKVASPIFGASAVALLIAPSGLLDAVAPVFALSGSFSALSALGLLSVRQRRRDVDTEFWSKVWAGPIGTTAFSIAQRLLGDKKPALAMTHRATELSLGMAAEQLYEDLPEETRQALGDVPSLVQRLQGDAQSLRKRYDEVQEMLAKVGDAASSPQFADLRGVRDTIHAKLSEAVGAMETIRLNLLRLHAGSATVPSLTTHLNLAAEVSGEVERLLAAHVEVERALGRAS